MIDDDAYILLASMRPEWSMMTQISNLAGTLDVTVGDAIVNGYR
jgi:hypothetical protein